MWKPLFCAESNFADTGGILLLTEECRQSANPLAWQQSGAEEVQQEESAGPLLPGQEDEEEPENLMDPEKCETCENRKYQDGSTDPGVSFKTPGKINPDAAASVPAYSPSRPADHSMG